jgi:hypothetical protein
MKYAWTAFRNLIVLGIAISLFSKADSDHDKIVFSLLVMIYLSIASSAIWDRMAQGAGLIALGKEFWRIRELLKGRGVSNSSLNAVFSEQEIARKKKQSEEYDREVERQFDRLRKREQEEIRYHHEAGEDKSSFEPSDMLLRIIKDLTCAINRRNLTHEDHEKMIRANIAVLNGASIDEVRKGYEYRSDNPRLIVAEGSEQARKDIDWRRKVWESSWDAIVKDKEYNWVETISIPEGFMTEGEEEKQRIADAEKNTHKAWIMACIEGGFISIIFFIALWNLVSGLHII